MEVLVACVLAYWLVRHGPELVAEAFAEAEYARRGELSPLAAARLKRLLDAGIDPATGGAARQFFGNAWRDAWLDLEGARLKRRANRAPGGGGPGWFDRVRDRFDEAVTDRADRWRYRRTTEPETTGPGPGPGEAGDGGPAGPPPPGSFTPPPGPQPDAPPDPVATPEPADEAPVRVDSTQGEPVRDAPQTTAPPATEEGNTTMTGTAVVAVTGVISGAAEARSIQMQADAATAAYVAAMAQVRRRVFALGEAAVGTIQQAQYSAVVASLMAAAEVAASAEADAKAHQASLGPYMGPVIRAFNRIST